MTEMEDGVSYFGIPRHGRSRIRKDVYKHFFLEGEGAT